MSFLWVASLATTSSLSGGRREPASSASSLITSTVVSVTLPTIPKHQKSNCRKRRDGRKGKERVYLGARGGER